MNLSLFRGTHYTFSILSLFISILSPFISRNMIGNVFNQLLVALCCADTVVILTNIITMAKIFFPDNTELHTMAPWTDGVCHMAVSASVFLMVSITLGKPSQIIQYRLSILYLILMQNANRQIIVTGLS